MLPFRKDGEVSATPFSSRPSNLRQDEALLPLPADGDRCSPPGRASFLFAWIYRSFSFVYSSAERSVWAVLNLAGKGEKRSAFSAVWVPPWFNAPL